MNWEIYMWSRSKEMEKLCSLVLALSILAVLFCLNMLKGGEK